MSVSADGYVYKPANVAEIGAVFKLARENKRKVVLRGAARSYGDASIGAECLILDLCGLSKVRVFDPVSGVLEAEPGITLEQIWNQTLPEGWFLPVVSGTMRTSLGGALAMNIHGKNNFQRGTLGEHVLEIDLMLPSGEIRKLRPNDELFYAAISGAGLLGVITRIRLQMKKVSAGTVKVEAVSCRNWGEQFAAFARFEGKAEYVVSWIDCFAHGDSAGRGILHAAWHDENDPSSLQLSAQTLPDKIMGFFPKSSVWKVFRLLNNRFGVRILNAAKQAQGRVMEHGKVIHQSLAAFNFLLDYVPGWEKSYLPGGLIQCQYFVPFDKAPAVFKRLVEMQQEAKLESYLAVMKRHRPDKFLFTHAVDGFSLALDFKVTASNRAALWELARRMNDYALENGGRFYFAKDSTLTAEQAALFLGRSLKKFKEYKKLYDPEGILTSGLAERLKLV
jgi:decaprenylphospho-beta-D-ribofuranose 2-oxidase